MAATKKTRLSCCDSHFFHSLQNASYQEWVRVLFIHFLDMMYFSRIGFAKHEIIKIMLERTLYLDGLY